MTERLRRLARLVNPFQPIRSDFIGATFMTIVAAFLLGAGIYGRQPLTIALGAINSLWCPIGPAAAVVTRRLRSR